MNDMRDSMYRRDPVFKGLILIALGIAFTLGSTGFKFLLFLFGCALIAYGLVLSGILTKIEDIIRRRGR